MPLYPVHRACSPYLGLPALSGERPNRLPPPPDPVIADPPAPPPVDPDPFVHIEPGPPSPGGQEALIDPEEWRDIFIYYDQDGSGSLNEAELRQALSDLYPPITDPYCAAQIIRIYARDRKALSYEDFKRYQREASVAQDMRVRRYELLFNAIAEGRGGLDRAGVAEFLRFVGRPDVDPSRVCGAHGALITLEQLRKALPW